MQRISLVINGAQHRVTVEPRRLLADVLRHDIGQYGVHLGCEQGVCGSCTVLLDGRTALACLVLAVQADGSEITTIEGVAPAPALSAVQHAFNVEHGLQCGFCTPGLIVAAADLLRQHPDPTEDEIRIGLSGNLCRCTGYTNIVKAVRTAARLRAEGWPVLSDT